MRLTDKDKFIKALDFLIYELHYPYDPPPFNDWTEEQKQTADWFIMHIRNMMEHTQETDAIPIDFIMKKKENSTYFKSLAFEELITEWRKENATE